MRPPKFISDFISERFYIPPADDGLAKGGPAIWIKILVAVLLLSAFFFCYWAVHHPSMRYD